MRIPLTPEEVLHPQEGYVIPVSTLHETITNDLCDMLRAFYEAQPEITIFREGDRVKKVNDYALVGVQEYVYIDHWTRKGQTVWEVTGYRLHENRYLPMLPDEDGALYCETLGLRIGVEDGQVWLEDGSTGKDLLTNLKAQEALEETTERLQAETEARAAAEERAQQESQARQAVQAEIARLQALLAKKTDH